jgi:hypothetical protein
MLRWIARYAPDELTAVVHDMKQSKSLRKKGRGVRPLYLRLRAELEEGLLRAALEATEEEARGRRLIPRREDGRFVFEWVRKEG